MMKAPRHLSAEAGRLFRQLAEECDFTAGEFKVLQAACEAWDRAKQAREQIDAAGLTIQDRFGQTKNHPLLMTERDARSQFLAGMRQLRLNFDDFSAPRRPGRPPEQSY